MNFAVSMAVKMLHIDAAMELVSSVAKDFLKYSYTPVSLNMKVNIKVGHSLGAKSLLHVFH